MFTHVSKIRVRYAETDKMGFVYYGYYTFYYEVGRTEAIRSLGVSYKSIEDSGILMPVLEFKSTYVLPAKYDDMLTIISSIKEMPTRKIVFHTEIQNENRQILNFGETTLVFLDKDSKRINRIPEEIEQALKPYFIK